MMGLFLWVLSVPFRLLLGFPLVGGRTTNASFFTDGNRWAEGYRPGYFGSQTPSRWALMAGWKRGAWTTLPPAAGVGGWLAWTYEPVATGAGAGVLLGLVFTFALKRWRERHHIKRYVEPLHQALASQLGYGPEIKARHWIDCPVNFRDEDAQITLRLPIDFYAGPDTSGRGGRSMRGGIDGYVYEKLGLSREDMTATYAMEGEAPSVTYSHRARVPSLVTAEDIAPLMEKAKESAPVIGMTRGRKPVSIDLDAESPHVAVSIGTGGGKSMLTRSAILHVLRHGGIVIVLDVKRTSHRWLKGHPRVLYLRDPADIADAIMRLRLELDRRQILTDEDDSVWPGPRILLVVEERNSMVGQIKAWWAKTREKTDPQTCPALGALDELAFMGREPMMHIWSIAQSATARTMGGPEGRENYACRILGRYSAGNWRMLVGNHVPMPKASRHRGRVQVVTDEVTECQTTMWETDEAREMAWSIFPEGLETTLSAPSMDEFFGRLVAGDMAGGQVVAGEVLGSEKVDLDKPAAGVETVAGEVLEPAAIEGPSPVSPVPAGPSHLGEQAGNVPDASPVEREDVKPQKRENVDVVSRENVIPLERPVTIKEALERRILTPSNPDLEKAKDAIKKARRRPGSEFPRPCGKRGTADLFKPSELARWDRNRPAKTAEETA